MAITITISGLTAQQLSDVKDAFDATAPRRGADLSLTKAQWVERCLLRHIKAVVKGWKRKQSEAALDAVRAQVDLDFPEV